MLQEKISEMANLITPELIKSMCGNQFYKNTIRSSFNVIGIIEYKSFTHYLQWKMAGINPAIFYFIYSFIAYCITINPATILSVPFSVTLTR